MRLIMIPSPIDPEMRYANLGGGGKVEMGSGCSLDSTKMAEDLAEKR